jgi:predicted transcriptional regulator
MDENISSLITSVEDIPKAAFNDQLGSVLDSIESSYQVIFVYNHHFSGLVSTYHALYKKHHPHTTKIGECIIHPPYITPQSSLASVCEQMAGERIYQLPVFDDDKNVIGAIDSKKILEHICSDTDLLEKTASHLTMDKVHSCTIHHTVKDIYLQLRSKDISRVVIVDEFGKLCGIVSRSDIKHAFIHPSNKQRFSKKNGIDRSQSFDEEESHRIDDQIRNYVTDRVEIAKHVEKNENLIMQLKKSGKNSIVIVDDASRPLGIVTIRCVLEAISKSHSTKHVTVNMERPSKNVTPDQVNQSIALLEKWIQKFDKRQSIRQIEIHFKEPKYTNHQTAEFNTIVHVTTHKGDLYIARAKDKDFLYSFRKAIRQLEKQQVRHHQKYSKHKISIGEYAQQVNAS